MEFNVFVDRLFEKGKEKGFKDMEVYYANGKKFESSIFKGEVDKYSISESGGLSFRGVFDSKLGYAYTEILDDESIDILIDMAIENAKIIETDDEVVMAEKYDEYKDLNLYNDKLSEYSKANKISILKEIENEIYKLDNRIKSINYNMYFESEGTLKIKNTNGVDVSAKNNLYGIYFAALSSENGQNKSGSKLLLDRNFENIDIKSFAKEVVEKSVSLLNSKPVKSGNYKVVFENTCFADLLASFSGIFSAESVQKDLSLLKGKLGEKIAADIVNIVDNPFLEGGFGNQSFDAEGVPTMITNLIKDGELKNYLYNLKTAKKDGVKSTGNASKGSYKSSVGIAASNLYLEKGNKNFDQILEEMGNGVLITDLAGLHSGLNPISGDFSLAASGFLVENGKKIHALDQFTVAGNFITLLQNVLCIANDSKFAFPQGDTFIASPSVLINELSISGE